MNTKPETVSASSRPSEAAVVWDSVATGWLRWHAEIERLETDLTERIEIAAGSLDGCRVVELGAGSGDFAARLAAAVGPAGRVLASDVSPVLAAAQKDRLAAVANAEGIGVADVLRLPFDAAAADVIIFRMGLMMAPDPDRALREVRRVLRPGGRFVTTVWGPFPDNPWLTLVGLSAAVVGLVSGGPPSGPGEPFSLTDADDVRQRLTRAGYRDVEVKTLRTNRCYSGVGQLVDMATSLAPSLAAAFDAATPTERTALRDKVTELTEQFATEDGSLLLPMCAHIAAGRNPG